MKLIFLLISSLCCILLHAQSPTATCLSTHWPGIFTMGTLDALCEPLQQKVDEVMKQKRYTHKNWVTKKFTGTDHSEKAWRERLNIPVTFLLGT